MDFTIRLPTDGLHHPFLYVSTCLPLVTLLELTPKYLNKGNQFLPGSFMSSARDYDLN